jgi:hypothetical protein
VYIIIDEGLIIRVPETIVLTSLSLKYRLCAEPLETRAPVDGAAEVRVSEKSTFTDIRA